MNQAPTAGAESSRLVPASGGRSPSDAVHIRCDLPDDTVESPRFDFDSAELRPRARYILDHVARCLTAGPLRDKGIWLTGHADPRGGGEYNELLGLRRADAARQYLLLQGVEPARIGIRSAGEREASGTEPVGYAFDRFLSIEVVELASRR